MCSTKHFKSRTISFQYDTGPQSYTYYIRQLDQLCTGCAPVCLVHSRAQWNRREENRAPAYHEGSRSTGLSATRGKFLSRRPPVSPSSYYHHLRPLGGDLFTLGIFLALIKIVVWYWLGRFWLTDKPIWKDENGSKIKMSWKRKRKCDEN